MFDNQDKKVSLAGFMVALLLLSGLQLAAAPLEDPTRPPDFVGGASGISSGQDEIPVWRVSSILISRDRRVAVVNGKTVNQGDEVDSARVIRISPTAVTFRNSVETFTVKLLPTQIKSVREK